MLTGEHFDHRRSRDTLFMGGGINGRDDALVEGQIGPDWLPGRTNHEDRSYPSERRTVDLADGSESFDKRGQCAKAVMDIGLKRMKAAQ